MTFIALLFGMFGFYLVKYSRNLCRANSTRRSKIHWKEENVSSDFATIVIFSNKSCDDECRGKMKIKVSKAGDGELKSIR